MKQIVSTILVAAAFILTACQPKEQKTTVAELEGSWQIVKVNDVMTPDTLLDESYISFDLTLQTISGKASCNLFNASFEKDEKEADKFSFAPIATTMMACPHLDFERQILDALQSSVQVARDGEGFVLLDENGNKSIVLKAMKATSADQQ
ncbi:META domain-containing protein [Porphyromonas cangingivalis]|uniref:META domain-containing protein n=1 Tax=Porphyromonas cangingivalis TaxID=36874 RepID=UPI00068C5B20|nr:META domain-containing protein [Porphyromonas cangingivalis]